MFYIHARNVRDIDFLLLQPAIFSLGAFYDFKTDTKVKIMFDLKIYLLWYLSTVSFKFVNKLSIKVKCLGFYGESYSKTKIRCIACVHISLCIHIYVLKLFIQIV